MLSPHLSNVRRLEEHGGPPPITPLLFRPQSNKRGATYVCYFDRLPLFFNAPFFSFFLCYQNDKSDEAPSPTLAVYFTTACLGVDENKKWVNHTIHVSPFIQPIFSFFNFLNNK